MVTKSKRLRLGLNKLISTGDRAEFQFMKSVNTIAEFHLEKGLKNSHLAGEFISGFFFISRFHREFDTPNKYNGSGSSVRENVTAMTITLSTVLNHDH